MDGFLRLVVPPGHVIMTSFPYLHIACDYADFSVYSVHRTNRSIRPEKRILCEGSDLLPLLWSIVVITAVSMGHSNFCEGYRLEVIFRFYLTFTTVFVWLFVWLFWFCVFVCCCCCCLRVGVVVLFCFGCIGLRVFDCCFLCVLFSVCVVASGCWLLCFLFLFLSLQGWGSFFIRSALWSTVFILCFYIRLFTPFFVDVDIVVSSLCVWRLVWMCEWVYLTPWHMLL